METPARLVQVHACRSAPYAYVYVGMRKMCMHVCTKMAGAGACVPERAGAEPAAEGTDAADEMDAGMGAANAAAVAMLGTKERSAGWSGAHARSQGTAEAEAMQHLMGAVCAAAAGVIVAEGAAAGGASPEDSTERINTPLPCEPRVHTTPAREDMDAEGRGREAAGKGTPACTKAQEGTAQEQATPHTLARPVRGPSLSRLLVAADGDALDGAAAGFGGPGGGARGEEREREGGGKGLDGLCGWGGPNHATAAASCSKRKRGEDGQADAAAAAGVGAGGNGAGRRVSTRERKPSQKQKALRQDQEEWPDAKTLLLA